MTMYLLKLESTLKFFRKKIKKQDQEISDLKEKNLDLENRLTDLEQYSRKNTLKIEGIEETNDENTFDTVLNICEKLNVDPPIELKDIDNCHRVGRSPTNGRPRAIIVNFSSYRARKRVYDTRLDLADHNKRLRERAAEGGSDDVFHEAGTEPTVARDFTEPPPEQHAGRRPGSRVTTRNSPAPEPSTDADPDSIPEDDANQHDVPELISRFPVYINEALCKSCSNLSFAARQLKHEKKINDSWTHDGRIKIRTTYNRVGNIDTMDDLQKKLRITSIGILSNMFEFLSINKCGVMLLNLILPMKYIPLHINNFYWTFHSIYWQNPLFILPTCFHSLFIFSISCFVVFIFVLSHCLAPYSTMLL